MSDGLRRRNNVLADDKNDNKKESESLDNPELMEEQIDHSAKGSRLTLMEEIVLMGLKDKEGYTSFWNDKISPGLRACMLVELALRDRIFLQGPNSQGPNRIVSVKSTAPTGDSLLDEALKIIAKSLVGYSVEQIIDYLSGETWNILMLGNQMRNVRERVAKNLAEKGILTTEKQNYVVFDLTTHPLVNSSVKEKLVKNIQDVLLQKWTNDYSKLSKHNVALILLAQYSDVLEEALTTLTETNYRIAMDHVDELHKLNFCDLSGKDERHSLFWAVFYALSKS